MVGMKKSGIAAVALAAVLSVSGTAFAATQFKSVSRSVGSQGALSVSFTVTGLGNVGTSQQVILASNVTADWGCVNRSLKVPKAENKISVGSPVVSNGYFTVPKSGSVKGTVSTVNPAQPAGWSCTGALTPTLLSVAYADITLIGGGVSQPVTRISYTFFA